MRDILKLFAQNEKKATIGCVRGNVVEYYGNARFTAEVNKFASTIVEHFPGASKIAIALPNNYENLVASYGSAVVGLTVVLPPANTPDFTATVAQTVQQTSADILITSAGVIPSSALEACASLKAVIVVEATHDVNFTSTTSTRLIKSWSDFLSAPSSTDVPASQFNAKSPAMICLSPQASGELLETEISHSELIAAVGAQIAILPRGKKISPEDRTGILLPLSNAYARVMTYAAMASGSSIILTTSTTSEVSLGALSPGKPTIIVASSTSIQSMADDLRYLTGKTARNSIQFRGALNMLRKGRMPLANEFFMHKAKVSEGLRLVFCPIAPGSDTLLAADLTAIRGMFGCSVIVALTLPGIATPITQTHIQDYRDDDGGALETAAGAPLPCVECKVVDVEEHGLTLEDAKGPSGELYVRGPGVQSGGKEDGWCRTGVMARWNTDGTLRVLHVV
ncbi:medium-chain fatty acid-CoA ligase faa2 [Saitoella coloradoensis]